MIKRVCVYCGSKTGKREEYLQGAKSLAEALVSRGIDIVYGGASIGMMGALADAVMEKGGRVTGIIPHDLMSKEVAHSGITQLRVVSSMHERKSLMADLSDGFIALPGGLGTIEELFEILTWAQLRFHSKPVGLLNISGYFDHLITFLDHMVDEEFVSPVHRSLLMVEQDPKILLSRFSDHTASERGLIRDSLGR